MLTKTLLEEEPRSQWWSFALEFDRTMSEIEAMRKQYDESKQSLESCFLDKVEKSQRGDELPPRGMKRPGLHRGEAQDPASATRWRDVMATRASCRASCRQEDMPFLADGQLVDIVLNPLGVPSRMNVVEFSRPISDWACAGLAGKWARPWTPICARTHVKPLRGKLKEIYGEHETIKALDDKGLAELGENFCFAARRSRRRCSTARARRTSSRCSTRRS